MDRPRRAEGADLAIFPELCLPGYPAEDLYLKRHFVEANRAAIEELARGVGEIVALVGFAEPVSGGGDHRHAHNSLAVLSDGEVRDRLPQEPAAQLRRLRRAALLRPRRASRRRSRSPGRGSA